MTKRKELLKTLKVSDLVKFESLVNFLNNLTEAEKQNLTDELKMLALDHKTGNRFLLDMSVEDLENYVEQEEDCLIKIYENMIVDEIFQDRDTYEEYMESEYDEEEQGLYDVIEEVLRYNISAYSPIQESNFRFFSEEIGLTNENIDNFKEIYLELLKDKFEDNEYLNEILTLGAIYINALYSEDEQEIDNFCTEFNRF